MQALILAAGRGSRLGDIGGGTSKCLAEVGGQALVEHQMESLAAAGIGPVGLVVGYAEEEVKARVGIRAEYLRNERWSETNSLYSFWLAREWARDGLVVLNCDILFAPAVLDRLLEVVGDVLVYDSGSGDAREQMSVCVKDGLLVDMAKDMPLDRVCGENVGILKFSAETAALLFAKAEELIAAGKEKDWLGSAVRAVAKERPIQAVDIQGLPWCEVDFAQDLHEARKTTWPAIQKTVRRARPSYRALRWAAGLLAFSVLSLTTVKALSPPREISWEALEPPRLEAALLSAGESERRWWLLDVGGTATARVEGPARLRLDVRPLYEAADADRDRLIVEYFLDGRSIGREDLVANDSGTWTLGERPVGKRTRIKLETPPGSHTVEIRLADAAQAQCLVRFQQAYEDP